MTMSTNLISGLVSGLDWRTIVDQLIAVDHRQVDLVVSQRQRIENKLSAWQTLNTRLLSLKTAAGDLKDRKDFNIYTTSMNTSDAAVKASDLLSVTAASSAVPGTYSVTITQLAAAQKLSSRSLASSTESLGSDFAGDIIINGRVITISATDSLADVKALINNANSGTQPTGVTASIVSYGTNDYRLILTSDATGEAGMSLLNGSSADLVQEFGWLDNTTTIKNAVTSGAQSDRFASSTVEIKELLGLTTTQSDTIKIKDGLDVYQNVSINLANDSLEDIKTAINNAGITGVSASVLSEQVNGQTVYRLQIDGSQDFIDSQNILQTLGVLEGGTSTVQGTTSGNAMTSEGATITTSTLLIDIDGYNTFTSGGSPAGDYITISGFDHSNNPVNTTFDITSSSTVQDLMDAIKSAFEAGGDKVWVGLTSEGKIQVADEETGASSLQVSLASTIQDTYSDLDWGSFSALSDVRDRELVQGTDAILDIDGVQLTSSDNMVDDVVEGITLELKKADSSTTITLNVERDLDAIIDNISEFVSKYNEVASFISQHFSYDEDTEETGGVLFGDQTLRSVRSDLTSILINKVWGISDSLSILGQAGVTLDNEGQLSVDETVLRGYLVSNFNDVVNLFAAVGTSDTGTLDYINHGVKTQAGTYTVNITQAAARASVTGTTDISGGGLAGDEVLTLTEGSKTATIALTAGMNLTEIVNTINSEVDKIYTEKLVGSEQLYADSGTTTPISSSTKWNSVYNSLGNSANLSDNDEITFTGTDRGGNEVSGTYKIQNVAEDTVGGLLSAIESAFGNKVTAAIDASGRITLTDNTAGNSELSLDITEPADLNFGTVLTTNSGGQEGRYSMSVTASDNGSGQFLVLTHDSYGSSGTFTVSQDVNNLGIVDDTYQGLDVAGTIDGKAATGSGQILAGDEDQPNIEGLSIIYTGTATGEVGDITLTLGVAEAIDRALYFITDAYSGYATYKQEAYQNRIDSLEDRISRMESRLNDKMERMINKFVAMEKALGALQSQSQWLTGQLSSITSMWSLE